MKAQHIYLIWLTHQWVYSCFCISSVYSLNLSDMFCNTVQLALKFMPIAAHKQICTNMFSINSSMCHYYSGFGTIHISCSSLVFLIDLVSYIQSHRVLMYDYVFPLKLHTSLVRIFSGLCTYKIFLYQMNQMWSTHIQVWPMCKLDWMPVLLTGKDSLIL